MNGSGDRPPWEAPGERGVPGDVFTEAEAVVLSLRAAEDRDPSGVCRRLMGLVAVLAETGVPRWVLHLAAGTGALDGDIGAAEVDAAAGVLADASLLGFTSDDSVVAQRLVMRVEREWLAAEGRLPLVLASAILVLQGMHDGIAGAWSDPDGVHELAVQVSAIATHVAGHPDALTGEALEGLLRLRLRSAYLLNTLGDRTGLAILIAEPLVTDCERVLGADHPDTLAARLNVAHAYQAAGRTAEAIPLLERTLADSERLLGTDHPDTLGSRNDLAVAYRDAGRTAEAIALLERTLADSERLLSTDHPSTNVVRRNLSALTDRPAPANGG